MRQVNKRLGLLGAAALIGTAAFAVASTAAEDASEVRDVPTFNGISLEGSMDMKVAEGETQRVEIFADARDMEFITTEVKGDKLKVKVKRRHRLHDRVRLVVGVKELDEVSINGSGDVVATGIDSKSFEAEINGSGDMDLAGTCGEVDYEINGSGDIDAETLACGSAAVEINGSGDVAIRAAEYISIEINGSGDIDVYGDPRLRRLSSNGSGNINIKN